MKFYVYEHWRPDKDICFYVGKGHGNRANDFRRSRNRHHKGIQRKLASLGMCAEVRLIADGLTEDAAYALERDRISFWLSAGVNLANKSSGGEGLSNPSPDVRARIAAAASRVHKGRKHSPEHCANRGAAMKEALGKPESVAKRSAITKARWSDPQAREKMLAGLRRAATCNERASIRSAAQIGNKKNLGKKASSATKARMSAAQLKRYAENPLSEEARANMSLGQRKRFAAEKARDSENA